MNVPHLEKLNKTMDAMIQYELLLSDIYKNCAETWAQDKAFWLGIAGQEVHHAENIKKMRGLINRKPSVFEAGRPLNPIALGTAINGLKDILSRLNAGEYSYEKFLIIAIDIEKSVLEANYAEIVKTPDVEYRSLMKTILDETRTHSKLARQKLSEVRSTAPGA